MKIRVRKPAAPYGAWLFECDEHGERVRYYRWEQAYEAAIGHACMKHKAPRWTCSGCLVFPALGAIHSFGRNCRFNIQRGETLHGEGWGK